MKFLVKNKIDLTKDKKSKKSFAINNSRENIELNSKKNLVENIQKSSKKMSISIKNDKKYKLDLSKCINDSLLDSSKIIYQDEHSAVTQTSEIISPVSLEKKSQSSWKIKLYALGLSKFSRILQIIAARNFFHKFL